MTSTPRPFAGPFSRQDCETEPTVDRLAALSHLGLKLASDDRARVVDWRDWPPPECAPLAAPRRGVGSRQDFSAEEEELCAQVKAAAVRERVPLRTAFKDLACVRPRHPFVAWKNKSKALDRKSRTGATPSFKATTLPSGVEAQHMGELASLVLKLGPPALCPDALLVDPIELDKLPEHLEASTVPTKISDNEGQVLLEEKEKEGWRGDGDGTSHDDTYAGARSWLGMAQGLCQVAVEALVRRR